MESRPSYVADMFYPGNPKMLKQAVLGYLEKATPPKIKGQLKAVIVPHAGYIYSGPVAAYAYKLLKGLDQSIKWKVLLLGLSHSVPYAGAAPSVYKKWKTPLGLVDAEDVRSEIGEKESIIDVPDAEVGEHSIEVQIPFLQVVMKDFVIYPLHLGHVRPDWMADDLLDFCARDDVIVVVSSDLSHFLEYNEAKKVDAKTSESICNLDIDEMTKSGDACGKGGILTLMHIANGLKWKCKMLDYRNSGDTAGEKDRVVGYGAWAFYK